MSTNTNSNVNYTVTAKDSGAASTFDKIGQAADRANKKTETFKQTFGRRGVFGDIGELIVGGGAIAGVTLLTRALGDTADRMSEVVKRFREGRTSISDFAAEMSKSLPIINIFADAGEKMRNFFHQVNYGEAATTQADFDEFMKRSEASKKTADQAIQGFQQRAARDAVVRGGDPKALARFDLDARLNEIRSADVGDLLRRFGVKAGAVQAGEKQEALDKFLQRMNEIDRDQKQRTAELNTLAAKLATDFLGEKISGIFDARRARANAEAMERRGRAAEVSSRIDDLLEERESLSTLMETASRVRTGATAPSVTSIGMSDVLASKERASSDPAILEARKQNKTLDSIDKEIKRMREELKNLSQPQPIASFN